MGEPMKETDHHPGASSGIAGDPSVTTGPMPPDPAAASLDRHAAEPPRFRHQLSVTCINCEYDLEGLGPEGRCPECGLEAEVSRREEIAWPREYLAALRRSVFLTRTPGLLILVIIGAAVLGNTLARAQLFSIQNMWQVVWVALGCATVAWSFGVVLLSRTSEARTPHAPSGSRAGVALSHWGSTTITIIAGCFLLALGVRVLMPSLVIAVPSGQRVHPASLPLAIFAGLLIFQHMVIVSQLATEIEHDDLRNSANAVRTLVPACLVLYALSWFDPFGRHWAAEFTIAILIASSISTGLALLMVCEYVSSALREIKGRRSRAIALALASPGMALPNPGKTPPAGLTASDGSDIEQSMKEPRQHLLCVGCGYDLHLLERKGLCPECATPVERSMRGDVLRFASPSFTRPLATGARILFWSYVFWPFQQVLSLVLVIPLVAFGAAANFNAPLTQTVALAFVALTSLGWWRVSLPDIASGPESAFSQSSRMTRAAAGLFALTSLTACALAYMPLLASTPISLFQRGNPSAMTLADGAKALTRLAHGGLMLVGLAHLRRIARRIPNARLVVRLNDCMAWARFLVSVLALMFLISLLLPGGTYTELAVGIGGLVAFVLVGLLYFTALVTFSRLSRSLQIVVRHSLRIDAIDQAIRQPRQHEDPSPAHPGSVSSIQPPPSTTSGSSQE